MLTQEPLVEKDAGIAFPSRVGRSDQPTEIAFPSRQANLPPPNFERLSERDNQRLRKAPEDQSRQLGKSEKHSMQLLQKQL